MKHLISGLLTTILTLILYWFLAVHLTVDSGWGRRECSLFNQNLYKRACTPRFDISYQQDIIILIIILIIFIPLVYGIIFWVVKSISGLEWDDYDPESEQDSDETDIEGKRERLEEEIKQLEAEEEIKQLEKRLKELKKRK